ncbi:unnamed protein product [Heligmosomoides polygyrus]|uniref:HTH_48 domain-containing protein n=1 Tax=Heligmosomoides polygyrus TaxID=6339 RepID=A0A183G6H8_HELPZ|nr:unnamed protein product [Heligmosomoides polygyrus]
METKMLRWTAGVTRLDRIRNDVIRQKFGVAPIADKMREARLRWYGHVLSGKEDSVSKIGLEFEVSGKRSRGRLKQRWSDTLYTDMKDQPQDIGRSSRVPEVVKKVIAAIATGTPTAEPSDGFYDGEADGKQSCSNHTAYHTPPRPDPYGDLVRDLPTFCYDDDDDTTFKDWFRRYGPIINDRGSSLPDERKRNLLLCCWTSSTDTRIKPIPTAFYHKSHDISTWLLLWTS